METICGPETQKALKRRTESGFLAKYCSGSGLDIGFRGSEKNASPLPGAIGIETDYPGYDGKTLPFADGQFDFVYSSHCLEHILDSRTAIAEWWRVIKVGGHLVIAVPHQFIYEKRRLLPSKFNEDHKRFYTPANLLIEIEGTLSVNSYRIRHLQDCDEGYDYAIRPEVHPVGEYEIECVIQKISSPTWALD